MVILEIMDAQQVRLLSTAERSVFMLLTIPLLQVHLGQQPHQPKECIIEHNELNTLRVHLQHESLA